MTTNSFTTDRVMQFWNKLIGKNTDLHSEKYFFDTFSSSVDTFSSSVGTFSSSVGTFSCSVDSLQVLFVVAFHPEKT